MSKTHNYSGHTVGDKSWPELRFYASNSNGIYGRSYSVSVPAAYSLIIIRTQAAATDTPEERPYVLSESDAEKTSRPGIVLGSVGLCDE